MWNPLPRRENKTLRQRNSTSQSGEDRKSLTPLTLTDQSVANKTSLVKELTNPLKLPIFPTIGYKNRSPSLGALSAWPLGCVKVVPARACNKVPHCFCIHPRLLWCLVGFRDPGTTTLGRHASNPMSCLWPQARMNTHPRVSSHFSNWNLYFNHFVQFFKATAIPLNKHLENDLNPIHSQPLATCHKESLTIFPHLES